MLNPGTRLAIITFAWIFETAAYVLLVWTGAALSMSSDDKNFGKLIQKTKDLAPYLVVGSGFVTVAAGVSRWSVSGKSPQELTLDELVSRELGRIAQSMLSRTPGKGAKRQ